MKLLAFIFEQPSYYISLCIAQVYILEGNSTKIVKEKLTELIEQTFNRKDPVYLAWNEKSKKEGKDQESIQSITTPDPGYQRESDNVTIRHHNRVPRGQSFPSR